MRFDMARRSGRVWGPLALVTLLGVGSGCGLDEVVIPPLSGPSTYGTGVRVTVTPDALKADGSSTAVVTVTLMDPKGQPLAGREVYILMQDDTGNFMSVGRFSTDRTTTDSRGQARVVYTAPGRTEFQNNARLRIVAKVPGSDATGAYPSFASIDLIAVDQRRWPPTAPGDPTKTPQCAFVMEPRWGPWYVGVPIRFQARDFAPAGYIIEYLWKFGDNTTSELPDVYHTYGGAGSYAVFHSVLDNNGNVDSCILWIDVEDAP